MKTLAKVCLVTVLAMAGLLAYLHRAAKPQGPVISEAATSVGDVVESVKAQGTLAPVSTVEIGSEVSGRVVQVNADFNSIVTRGEVLVQIDPSTVQDQLDSANAELAQVQLAQTGHQATLASDERNLERARDLLARGLVAQSDLEAAVLQVEEDQAQARADAAAIKVAAADIEQAQVKLDHCTIRSPIDGVVIERDIDEGQVIEAGVQAPQLFVLAPNLRTLRLLASVDDANVSQIGVGQAASFTVEDYPGVRFHGTVQSVRLNATQNSDVVTYTAVIDASNPDLRLRPSMTAQITMDVWRESNVLRVPNSALAFRPTVQMFQALGQPLPEPVRLGVAGAPVPLVARVASVPDTASASTRPVIDRLLKAAVPLETTGRVFVLHGAHLTPVMLTLGLTDGKWTAVEDGALSAGDAVATAVVPAGGAGVTAPRR